MDRSLSYCTHNAPVLPHASLLAYGDQGRSRRHPDLLDLELSLIAQFVDLALPVLGRIFIVERLVDAQAAAGAVKPVLLDCGGNHCTHPAVLALNDSKGIAFVVTDDDAVDGGGVGPIEFHRHAIERNVNRTLDLNPLLICDHDSPLD